MEIKTLIFFDLETTGLFSDRYFPPAVLKKSVNPGDFTIELKKALTNVPQLRDPLITEISFVAVDRDAFIRGIGRVNENFQEAGANSSIRTDLALKVFTRLVKPSLNEAQWNEYEIRRASVPALKYSKDDLAPKCSFRSVWNEAKEFLEECPKPACFVAHNGLGYDMRVLYGELKRNNMLPVEGLNAFKDIRFIDSMLAFWNIEEKQKNNLMKLYKGLRGGELTLDYLLDANKNASMSLALLRRWTENKFETTSEGTWTTKTTPGKRKSFKLESLFNEIVKGTAEFHRAQDDSEALLQICLAYRWDFLKYLDSAAAIIPF